METQEKLPKVELRTPEDFNRFPAATQKLAFDWLDEHLRPR
jgi:hypothetical protein